MHKYYPMQYPIVDTFASDELCERASHVHASAYGFWQRRGYSELCIRSAKRRDMAVTSLDEFYTTNVDDKDGEVKKKDAMDALRVEATCRARRGYFERRHRYRWVQAETNCYSPPVVYKDRAGINRARTFMERFENVKRSSNRRFSRMDAA